MIVIWTILPWTFDYSRKSNFGWLARWSKEMELVLSWIGTMTIPRSQILGPGSQNLVGYGRINPQVKFGGLDMDEITHESTLVVWIWTNVPTRLLEVQIQIPNPNHQLQVTGHESVVWWRSGYYVWCLELNGWFGGVPFGWETPFASRTLAVQIRIRTTKLGSPEWVRVNPRHQACWFDRQGVRNGMTPRKTCWFDRE